MATSFNHFGAIGNALPDILAEIVRNTAFKCQTNIAGFIRANGQVDTGFMLDSGYVVTSTENSYTGGQDALPSVEKPPDNQTAYVAWAAFYSIYQDMGTRYLPARPFFEPGVEQTRPDFEAELSTIEDKLRGAVH